MVHPSEMFWRQLRFAEFDVSEMSMSSLIISVSRGDTRWVAIPVFTMRKFFHTSIIVRTDSGIAAPADLRGKRIGVPEYQQTWAIWARGILQHEFGVHARDIEWFMERNPDKSHGGATGFTAPEGVRVNQIPPTHQYGRDAGARRARRGAALSGREEPGRPQQGRCLGRDAGTCSPTRPPKGAATLPRPDCFRSTIPSWCGARCWRAIPGSRSISTRLSWRPRRRSRATGTRTCTGISKPDCSTAASSARSPSNDPLAYGFKAARPVLETITQYVHEQGLCARRVGLEEIFAPSTLDV